MDTLRLETLYEKQPDGTYAGTVLLSIDGHQFAVPTQATQKDILDLVKRHVLDSITRQRDLLSSVSGGPEGKEVRAQLKTRLDALVSLRDRLGVG